MMAGLAGLAAVGVILVQNLGLGINPASVIMMAGGLELMLLSAISSNPRFIRAINAKYQKDIDAFQKTKTLVDYYNVLTLDSQRRFDKLRKRIRDIRENFKKIHTTVPQLVNNFLEKMNAIELSYVRLLYYRDKFPEMSNESVVQQTVQEIDKLNQELKDVSNARLKRLKEKRLHLLELRMENYHKLKENREVIEEQLQTIEEMVEYIKDQPMTLQNTEREDIMIDNLLFETEQTQQTLEEIENLMQSEFYSSSDESEEELYGESGSRMKE
jgi:flagellar biosynthesis GTPase FlhF